MRFDNVFMLGCVIRVIVQKELRDEPIFEDFQNRNERKKLAQSLEPFIWGIFKEQLLQYLVTFLGQLERCVLVY